MLNVASLKTVNRAKFSQRFVRPCYDSYCFANLPSTITHLLTGTPAQPDIPAEAFADLPTRYDRVVFFYIDAFGWNHYTRNQDKYPFLQLAQKEGTISKITSQFPSTTSAHVTCIHTGLNVGQSGIYEWNYYEPLVDEIISPLLFSYARDKIERDTLKRSSIPPADFFPQQTFYQTLQTHGVTSHVFQYQAYTPSTYSDIVFRGANVHPYDTFTNALDLLSEQLRQPFTGPTYYFLYFDRIDTISHNHGPYSRMTENTIDYFLNTMDQFYRSLQGQGGNTLLIITADHGHVPVDPQKTFYLNLQLPSLTRYIKTNRQGNPIVPAGSPRDMFLYIQEKAVDEVIATLQEHLSDKAEVYATSELLEQGFFGTQPPSPQLLGRLGNVVILPYKYETVWWYEEGKFEMHFQGHHGGLTPDEMEIPLILLPL